MAILACGRGRDFRRQHGKLADLAEQGGQGLHDDVLDVVGVEVRIEREVRNRRRCAGRGRVPRRPHRRWDPSEPPRAASLDHSASSFAASVCSSAAVCIAAVGFRFGSGERGKEAVG